MKPPYFIAKDLQLIFRIVYLITEIVEKTFLLKFKIDEAKTEYLRCGRIKFYQRSELSYGATFTKEFI